MDDKDLLTDDTFNYAKVTVTVVGLFLVVVALTLYKIYVDHQHNQAKEQEYWEKMEEYQATKSGLAAQLRDEVIATRTDSEIQKMKQKETEQDLRQRHKKEMEKQEKKQKIEMEAKMREFEKQKQKLLEKEKQSSQEYIRQLEGDVSSWERKAKYFESELKKQNQKVLDEANYYEESRTKHDLEIKQKDDLIAMLKKMNEEQVLSLKAFADKNLELQQELADLRENQETPQDMTGTWKRKATSFAQRAVQMIPFIESGNTEDGTATPTSYSKEPAKQPVYNSNNSTARGKESNV